MTPVRRPSGVDPLELLEERETRLAERIHQRISQLSGLPGEQLPEDARVRSQIELRALRLLNLQRQIRQEVSPDFARAGAPALGMRESGRACGRNGKRDAEK